MAVEIYYQEDCNLALLERKNHCDYRMRQSGTCSRIELKGVRL